MEGTNLLFCVHSCPGRNINQNIAIYLILHCTGLFAYGLEFAIGMCSMFGSKLNLTLLSEKQGLASTSFSKSSRKNFAMHFHTAGGCKLCYLFY